MKNKPFVLGKKTVEPGEKKVVLFPAPNINTQISVDIPVHVYHGENAGPKLFVTSAIHGDELNGIEIIRRLHNSINLKKLSGTIITMPVVNIYGIIMQSRYMADRRDLNRSFPGAKKGTLAARLAHGVIKQVVSHCDYGIDLHTGAFGRMNMPQLRVDFSAPGSKKFALSFNTPVVLESKQRDGSLRQAASELGIPVLVYEGGEALRYSEFCIRAAVNGIHNVLHDLKMIPHDNKEKTKKIKSVITNTSRWVRAPMSGLVQPVKEVLTRRVKKGEILAHIHDPFLIQASQKVIAPFEGIVIGQALKIIATEGDGLFHIASFKKTSGIGSYIDDLMEEVFEK